jgi:chromosome segregation ATPase
MIMTQMSYKLFHLSKLSINPALKGSFAVWVLIVLFVFFFPFTSFTEEKQEAGDTLTSSGQMAKSLENQITGHLAELADIKEQLRQLETLQNTILAKIKDYEAQSTVHGQLLLMSKPRLEDLENAIRDNLLASRTLGEEVERFQKDINSKSISYQKTSDQIEIAQKQITNSRIAI